MKGLQDLEGGGEFPSAPKVVLPTLETEWVRLVGTAAEFGVVQALENPCLTIEKPPNGLDAYRKCRVRQ